MGAGGGCEQGWSKKPHGEEVTSASNPPVRCWVMVLAGKGRGLQEKDKLFFTGCVCMQMYMCDLDNIQNIFVVAQPVHKQFLF